MSGWGVKSEREERGRGGGERGKFWTLGRAVRGKGWRVEEERRNWAVV